MIAVIDYGAGNLFSVCNALKYLDIAHEVTKDSSVIDRADAVILPGVGAFPAAMESLRQTGLVSTIKENAAKKPLLGICLGMQMLFERSDENGDCDGLGLIPGEVHRIPSKRVIIPHMGWNELVVTQESPLLNNIETPVFTYFVHSYQAFCEDRNIIAYCDYDGKIPALVTDGKFVFGAQYHPEKSGEKGLQMLRNFEELAK
ncbi:MAG: imidazole glycerol phosphate synthase subunit HisH [Oscillospiraceae bacterium]|nr:imidazole glycerol phosphate synthase subunit HisH [Oscillospiraceae bacterium]MBQ5338642.1 imidazole glycerol phosphate synthase subunit HisH [Oscillospiraceae bacterium]